MESSMKRTILLAGSVIAALALTPAYADSPRQFLRDALQGDNSEIMLGRMAAERARSPAVREFGQTLVSDHQQARQEVRDLARNFGLRGMWQSSQEAQDEREKLDGLQGREFDREFVRFMVDDHRKDVSAFRDEANENHGQVSDLARNQLPTLRNHLRMAIALERSDGRTSQGGWNTAWGRDNDRGYQNNNQPNRDDTQQQYRSNRSWER